MKSTRKIQKDQKLLLSENTISTPLGFLHIFTCDSGKENFISQIDYVYEN